MRNMKYFFQLSLKYIAKNRARTMYSVMGIMIAYILCFTIFTAAYSYWDYELYSAYCITGSYHPAQLICYMIDTDDLEGDSGETTDDEGEQGVTRAQIEAAKKLEQSAEVENLIIEDEGGTYSAAGLVTTEQMQEGGIYIVYINLKDTSNLRRSAETLSKMSRLDVKIMTDVETFLNQGDEPFLYFFRAVITLIGAFISCFSAVFLRNTLVISVMERMRDYGLLRCVGMSKKQLFKLLLSEGILLGIGAVVPGTGVGYAFLKILESLMNRELPFEIPFAFHFYPAAVMYCFLFMIATILFSLIEPARQATHLTPADAIHRNIVLVRRSGALKEKYNYTKTGIYGKIFGVEGEYARKNMKRNRGRAVAYFAAVLISVIMLVTTQTAFDSLKASYENRLEGRKQLYQEMIMLDGDREGEEVDKICEEIRSFEDVTKAESILQSSYRRKCDKRFKKQTGGECLYFAYGESQMEQLKPYLIEGKINYRDMVAGNQVLLLDMRYHVKDFSTDFVETDIRSTDYHAGDTITFKKDSLGNKVTYTIAGILSDDIFNGALRGEEVELIFPQETAIREERERLEAERLELQGGEEAFRYISWEWSIGIARNIKLPDDEIQKYCEEHGLSYYDELFDDSEWGDLLESMEYARGVSFVIKFIGFFIGFIALIQMINTIYASIVVRKKELWLYSVVGMSRRQLKKMIILEHTIDVALAIIMGYLLSWGLSWYVIEYLINQDGSVIYAWSWARLLPICVTAYGVLVAVVLFAVRGKKRKK